MSGAFRWGAAALAVAALTSCQTWSPGWSEVSGARYTVTDYNRFGTQVNLIDSRNPGPQYGYGRGAVGYSYYKIDPGEHTIELSALNTRPNWVSGINRENLRINLEPCKRYYLNAQFDNALLADWKPVVDYVEPIAGCGAGGGGY
ncbi:MAG TPA: hypothetical protein VGI14_13750 [Casimicrobiaceae bacterium]|jgi:hypothetical protein